MIILILYLLIICFRIFWIMIFLFEIILFGLLWFFSIIFLFKPHSWKRYWMRINDSDTDSAKETFIEGWNVFKFKNVNRFFFKKKKIK